MMSVCLSVSRSVSGCKSLTVTVTVAAVFQLEVWSGRRNSVRVCPSARTRATRRPRVSVCRSLSVCLSVCLSESVWLRVCLSPSRCHVTTAASAGACVPAARPPASECPPRRPGRFVLSESSVVPEIWLLFLYARRFGLKRFDSVTFCFPICRSGFKICEMIVFETFFLSPLINSVLTISTKWLNHKFRFLLCPSMMGRRLCGICLSLYHGLSACVSVSSCLI